MIILLVEWNLKIRLKTILIAYIPLCMMVYVLLLTN